MSKIIAKKQLEVPTNGMHDYVYGVGRALAEIAKRIEGKREVTPKSVNLLGVTPLDFGPQEHVDALIQNVEQAGWKVLSTWAMGDTLENLARAPEAEVNLVVSSTGLRAAEILRERFGTPYVTGTPIRGFMKTLLNAIEEKKQVAYLEEEKRIRGFTLESGKRDTIILIGEPVIMKSLAAAIEIKYRINVKVICPLKETDGLLAVCGKNFEEVTRFHSYIYAEDKLHDRFQEMTGIERKDLLSAPDYELVMEEVAEQLEAWEVSRIYVWGPDKYVIQRDLLEYRKDISKRTRKIVNRILRMIKDIEGTYSAKLDLQSAGIGSLKIICGLGTEVSHNALDDAVDLKNIIRHIDLKGCSEHMLQIMKKYTSEKEVYYRLRRFREKWDDVSEGIQEKSLSLLKELGKVDTVEARALRDDLLVMCTGEAMAFPTLEEYIQKENAKTGKVICDKNDK